jgi:hypothetical protein
MKNNNSLLKDIFSNRMGVKAIAISVSMIIVFLYRGFNALIHNKTNCNTSSIEINLDEILDSNFNKNSYSSRFEDSNTIIILNEKIKNSISKNYKLILEEQKSNSEFCFYTVKSNGKLFELTTDEYNDVCDFRHKNVHDTSTLPPL